MIVITSGARYIDIDAYACIVAYDELLKLLGEDSIGMSTATINESVSASLRTLQVNLVVGYQPNEGDQFVVMDLSDPSQFDAIVRPEHVVEVFDHHVGFEAEWQQKLGDGSHIEFIGACATLVYEQWMRAGKQGQMSNASAQLLAAAIIDNTLNFNAEVTTNRDRAAYGFLTKHAGLSDAWVASYFTECQQSTLGDLPLALRNDTKYFKRYGLDRELTMGQITLWDAKQVVEREQLVFGETLRTPDKFWLVNLISISEGKSYFITDNPMVQAWVKQLTGAHFIGEVGITDRLWLRKEVLKAAEERTKVQR